jgi:enoyl-CoA hydratase/carnithine racemase
MSLAETALTDAVATLTLNRPEARNALSVQLCEDIVVALHGLDLDPELRVVVIRGEGAAFCSGADLAVVSDAPDVDFLPAFEAMLEAVTRFRLPTIAAIHGAALGGGLQLATVCDFRVATINATLGIPSSKLGILVNFENVQRLVLLAGIAVAKEVLMTGRTYSGDEAAGIGLVNRAIAPERLDEEVSALAQDLAALAPLSVQGVKRSIQAIADHLGGARATNPEVVAEIDRLVTRASESDDLREGLRAMSDKRRPRFHGR